MASEPQRGKSSLAFERACKVLVGGVNSPVRSFRAVGGAPLFIERASGPYVFDVDGNRYVDLICSWGASVLGHAHPDVVHAVSEAAARGLSFGACCTAETELAELIVNAIPSVEMLRFVNSGTEAAMSAIRLARAATGRTKIIKFAGGYHGHVDSLLVAAGSGAATFGVPDSAGVPEEFASTTLVAIYNDIASVKAALSEHSREVAAVLVEPIAGNMGFVLPGDRFLEGLRRLCDEHGCLLIFDEVMTGFRVARGGYQNLCGVRPEITCLGKIIGGGMPVAAYGGSRQIMSHVSPLGTMYQAGTLSGNPVAMAAGIATLRHCKAELYLSLEESSRRLAHGLRDAAKSVGLTVQSGYCGGLWGFAFSSNPVQNFEDAAACDHNLYSRFFHAMLDRGVLLPPSGYEAMFVSFAHAPVIDDVLAAATDSFRSLRA